MATDREQELEREFRSIIESERAFLEMFEHYVEREVTHAACPARGETMMIGQAVRQRRESFAYTMSELARRAGISKAYLSQLESRNHDVSLTVAYRLAFALDCTVDDLTSTEVVAALRSEVEENSKTAVRQRAGRDAERNRLLRENAALRTQLAAVGIPRTAIETSED